MDHPYVCYVSLHVSAFLAILSETTFDIIERYMKVYFLKYNKSLPLRKLTVNWTGPLFGVCLTLLT
jgi:hypothetical protein